MLAEEVFVQQFRLHWFGVREKSQCFTGKLNQMFEDHGIMDGIVDSFAPSERAVAGDEHTGTVQWIATVKGFDDDVAGIDFVIVSNFASVQSASAGDGPMKIIGVSRAESRNGSATLCPGRGKQAVGVNDAAYPAKSAIENKMSVSIRAGL